MNIKYKKINQQIFPVNLLPSLVCQVCSSDLVLHATDSNKEGVKNGKLKCSCCDQSYLIVDGIVFFLDEKRISNELLVSEINMRDKQAYIYDKRMEIRHDKELVSTMSKIGKLNNKKVIEYGCGTGRVTMELCAKASYVLASDFSLNSLRILQNKIRNNNIGLVLADSTQFKTKDNYFDLAFSAQFIEHIPGRRLRKQYFLKVNNTLKEDGEFLSSLYHYDLRMRVNHQPKEGAHKDSIYFYYYTPKEIRNELVDLFDIQKISKFDITLPLEVRLGVSNKISAKISHICENIYPLNLFGHLLFFKVKRNNNKRVFLENTNYNYSKIFFKKYWFWFTEPINIKNIDILNFFAYKDYNSNGFKKKKGITTVINLTDDIETIWGNTRKSYIRKQIERGRKKNIKVKQNGDFEEFQKIYIEFRKRNNLPRENYGAIKKNGILFSAYYNKEMIAGGVFIVDSNKRFARAWVLSSKRFSDGVSNEIAGQANRMVIWEAIKYFKNNGYEKFDLGGLDHLHGNAINSSLNTFKEAFGGKREDCYFYTKINSKILKFIKKIKR